MSLPLLKKRRPDNFARGGRAKKETRVLFVMAFSFPLAKSVFEKS